MKKIFYYDLVNNEFKNSGLKLKNYDIFQNSDFVFQNE